MDMRSGSAVSRFARQLFVWRNPLARPGDRLESAVAVVAVTMVLLGLPVAAAMGSEIHAQQAVVSERESRTRYQVDAVLLAGTPSSVDGNAPAASVTKHDVPATWTLPDGKTRQGEVETTGGMLAGSEVRIWVDDRGSVVDVPLTAEGAVFTAVMVAIGSWFALGCAMAVFYVVVRWTHTWLRRQQWGLEWAAVEPGWRKLA
ncbi:hypothetical protein F4560_000967 [Saccharothrix ecbatanensis]|uniref:Transmembrane protein n=1 Tax=Saccharothrix ecbatanensis TaxID=1105145 RepID=A0A7W9HFA2_9PSEU|nr:hypothetical protein [Saccharothrix ecbatanensis]MBB5801199.1 hypothetical protein [Saccharothrix ecbatanensis]